MKRLFPFEDADESLEWIPLAGRRALDAVGIELPFTSWQELSLEARGKIVEEGGLESVGGPIVEAALAHLDLPRQLPWREPSELPEEVAAASGPFRRALEGAWPELGGLERYALVKTLRSPRRAREEQVVRLQEICRFFLEASVHQGDVPPRSPLSHLNERGEAHMVDVAGKETTERVAVAEGWVRMERSTWELLAGGRAPKGDVLSVARIAGIQAAKRTHELIPLCHLIRLSSVVVDFSLDEEASSVRVRARAQALDRTGVEMEALVAASVAALTLYDMLKAVDRAMTIAEVRLVSKSGGRSGDFTAELSSGLTAELSSTGHPEGGEP